MWVRKCWSETFLSLVTPGNLTPTLWRRMRWRTPEKTCPVFCFLRFTYRDWRIYQGCRYSQAISMSYERVPMGWFSSCSKEHFRLLKPQFEISNEDSFFVMEHWNSTVALLKVVNLFSGQALVKYFVVWSKLIELLLNFIVIPAINRPQHALNAVSCHSIRKGCRPCMKPSKLDFLPAAAPLVSPVLLTWLHGWAYYGPLFFFLQTSANWAHSWFQFI